MQEARCRNQILFYVLGVQYKRCKQEERLRRKKNENNNKSKKKERQGNGSGQWIRPIMNQLNMTAACSVRN